MREPQFLFLGMCEERKGVKESKIRRKNYELILNFTRKHFIMYS